MEPGTRVTVDGLQARPDLNRQCGVVVDYAPDRQRYRVKMDAHGAAAAAGEEMYLRPANLSKLGGVVGGGGGGSERVVAGKRRVSALDTADMRRAKCSLALPGMAVQVDPIKPTLKAVWPFQTHVESRLALSNPH